MKIHKPDDLALLYRVLRWQGCDILSIGAIAGFRLDSEAHAPLLSEVEIWQHASTVSQDSPLDEGVPKPAGEFLLFGTAYAPGGQPVPHLPVSVRVGGISKQLFVFGHRHVATLGGLSAPEPFDAMPLTANGDAISRIEDPAHRIVSAGDTPPPAGFGPLASSTVERTRHLGPFDRVWHAREWPHLPQSTSVAYAHLARADQRRAGFWRGDETVELLHMSANRPLLTSALPALRARCFVRRRGKPPQHLEEVAAQAETVWLLPDLGCGLVLYRAVAQLNDEDGDDVSDVVAGWEPLHAIPRATTEYEAMLFTPDPAVGTAGPPAQPHEVAASAPAMPTPDDDLHVDPPRLDELEASVAALERDADAMLRDAGLTRADVERYLPSSEAEPAVSLSGLTALVEGLERQAQSLADAHGVTPEMIAAHVAPIATTDHPQSILDMLEQLESDVAAMQASLGVTPEMLDDIVARYPELAVLARPVAKEPLKAFVTPAVEPEVRTEREEGVATSAPRPVGVRPSRETVIAGHTSSQSFAGADLSGIDLGGLSLAGADFSEANLTGTNFEGTDLSGCSMRNARCAGARFSRAKLSGALLDLGDFTGADFTASVMEEARCTGALFDGATMASVRACNCVGVGASYADCRLNDADFANANVAGARFHRSVLDSSSFVGAHCERSEWYGASAQGANFAHAKLQHSRADTSTILRGADLSGAHVAHANWEGADLRNAVFLGANVDGADFSGIQGDGARLCQASARGTRFDKASLVRADLTQANLFGGSLRRAKMSHAALEGANLYGVDAYGADLRGARLGGAMIAHTVLAAPERPESMAAGITA